MCARARRGFHIKTSTEVLAKFAEELSFNQLPKEVIDKAKTCVYDTLACCFGGYDLEWSRIAVEFIRGCKAVGEATIWADGAKTVAPDAAFANACMANSILHEDTHTVSGDHPGTVVVPSAFAVAEREGASGEDVIASIVCGYEVHGRISEALAEATDYYSKFHQCFRPTGIVGPFGAAASAGKLLDLSENLLVNAFGVAGNCSAGLNQWVYEGTMEPYYHTGFASRNGVTAALLAQKGLIAPKFILEGEKGFWKAFVGTSENIGQTTEALGTEFEIMKIYHKPAPVCSLCLSPIQVAMNLVRKHNIAPDEVSKVVVNTCSPAKTYPGLDYVGPFRAMQQAQISLPFSIGAIIVNRDVSLDIYKKYDDPRVLEIAKRVKIEVDPEADSLFPKEKISKVDVVMKDGSAYCEKQNGLCYPTKQDVVDKFKYYAGKVLTDEAVNQIADAIAKLEKLGDMSELTNLCVL